MNLFYYTIIFCFFTFYPQLISAMEGGEKEDIVSVRPPLPTTISEVGRLKNPDFFETSWEDLERMANLNPSAFFSFHDYVWAGYMGPGSGQPEEHGSPRHRYKIGIAYDEKINRYIKFFCKYYDFKSSDTLADRERKLAEVCAESGAFAMSQLLSLRLVPPSHVRCDNYDDLSKANYVASAQFLVEANFSFGNVEVEGCEKKTRGDIYGAGKRLVSPEDMDKAFLLRACLGSYDRSHRNMLFHQQTDGTMKAAIVDLEDLYQRLPSLVKSMNKKDKFRRSSIALFRTITLLQIKVAFGLGAIHVPSIYNEEWFASLLAWNKEFLDHLEDNGQVLD